MKRKTAHEPEAEVMSAAEVADDARQMAEVLRSSLMRSEPVVSLSIPLSVFLSALDNFTKEELVMLRKRLDERLAT